MQEKTTIPHLLHPTSHNLENHWSLPLCWLVTASGIMMLTLTQSMLYLNVKDCSIALRNTSGGHTEDWCTLWVCEGSPRSCTDIDVG
jgi:hypothetical protein